MSFESFGSAGSFVACAASAAFGRAASGASAEEEVEATGLVGEVESASA